MTSLVRTIGLTTASTIAMISSALADFGSIEDELFLPETPMTTDELREARGAGFPIAGMQFNIEILMPDITVDPLPDGVFGEAGIFGNNGIFGDNGVFGGNGVFGDNGVFGEDGVLGPQGTPLANDNIAVVVTTTPAANSTPQPSAPVSDTAPATDNTPPEIAVPVIETNTLTISPPASSAPMPHADTTTHGGGDHTPDTQMATSLNPIQQPQPLNNPSDANVVTATTTTNEIPSETISEPSSASMSFTVKDTNPPPPRQTLAPQNVATRVFNNDLDNVLISRNIDINVRIPNFSLHMSLSNANSMISRTISNQVFLGALN